MSNGIDAESLMGLPMYQEPVLSPAGDKIAYWWTEGDEHILTIRDLTDGTDTQVDGIPSEGLLWIDWDEDDGLFFHHDPHLSNAGPARYNIYRTDFESSTDLLVDMDGACYLWDVGPAGRYLLFNSDADGQRNFYCYDRQEDCVYQATAQSTPIWKAKFSPDANWVAYSAWDEEQEAQTVYITRRNGKEVRTLPVDETQLNFRAWFPDGERILLSRGGVYDLESDSVTWVDIETSDTPITVLSNSDGFIAHREDEVTTRPIIYDIESGETSEIALEQGVTELPWRPHLDVFLDESTFLLSHSTSTRRRELLAYDYRTDKYEVLIDTEYDTVSPESFVSAEYITYESTDGLAIGALLYDSGRRPSPAVVMVHGGPQARADRGFSPEVQYLVQHGYTVLRPNYRGSTGRGSGFQNRINGDLGGKEIDDVAAGNHWLQDQNWIVDDQIAVYGHSHGGYQTYMQLVTHPGIWAAGIAWSGTTDLRTRYEQLELPGHRSHLESLMGDPEKNAQLWRERSPITHVEDIESPVLIIHGAKDGATPVEQARQFRTALEDLGWTVGTEFEYYESPELGHGTKDPVKRSEIWETIGSFLGTHMCPNK